MIIAAQTRKCNIASHWVGDWLSLIE